MSNTAQCAPRDAGCLGVGSVEEDFVGDQRSSRQRTPALIVVSVLALAGLLLPAGASAHQPPIFTTEPGITGSAVVGSTLTATFVGDQGILDPGDPPLTVSFRWRRCPSSGGGCAPITGATFATYVVSSADLGQRLEVSIELANSLGTVEETSPRTGVVTAPPAPPTPIPTGGGSSGSGGSTSFGGSGTTPDPLVTLPRTPVTNPGPRPAGSPAFLRPFPVVRIRGFFAPGGAKITLLSVTGSRGANVRVRCSGRGCPVRRMGPLRAPVRLRKFERFLRAGVVVEVRVDKASKIGKYTSFHIRARRAPLRRDGCLMPGRPSASRCPLAS
jgi:hypothetical protein